MATTKCKFWLPKKKRFCTNLPLGTSPFCGNHTARNNDTWVPCPIDPSHSVLQDNLEAHLKKCPFKKYAQSLSLLPYYSKGINGGGEGDELVDYVSSEMKRKAVLGMTAQEVSELIRKIKSVHALICNDIQESHKIPDACGIWTNHEIDRKLPFQEKHVLQQASILGNLEDVGVIKPSGAGGTQKNQSCANGNGSCVDDDIPAVVEFGAGRGYLTQMLADCYGIKKVFLVERKSYKLKADRSLRQIESLTLERLRIDIEDLNLNAVESLKGIPYLAIGKHLCGPATDMTIRCCLAKHGDQDNVAEGTVNTYLRGLALATCCHHLCQWKHYINKGYMSNLGIDRDYFHAITWFTSWAVDADHGTALSDVVDATSHPEIMDSDVSGEEGISRNMSAVERALLGFMCKDIIDMGRSIWMKEHGLDSRFLKYVPSNISPENHLLIAKHKNILF
ncbi:uncharacterized protein LOC108211136 isoform X2 [Daucus carota subsp. sativus]|uniref:uncharacterized protein LOC108211136 isoform X2 n=1 Tax=Daucus carota subsp. sativus TaxID=79200 RepID=UPI003083836B